MIILTPEKVIEIFKTNNITNNDVPFSEVQCGVFSRIINDMKLSEQPTEINSNVNKELDELRNNSRKIEEENRGLHSTIQDDISSIEVLKNKIKELQTELSRPTEILVGKSTMLGQTVKGMITKLAFPIIKEGTSIVVSFGNGSSIIAKTTNTSFDKMSIHICDGILDFSIPAEIVTELIIKES